MECRPVSAAAATTSGLQPVWALLGEISDPEIPVLSIIDLGVVRHVRRLDDGRISVGLTPTYSGCPATDAIRASVRTALDHAGFIDAVIDEVLAPPWSSDWLTPEAHGKLRAFGIAPPVPAARGARRAPPEAVRCPRCRSSATERVSEFGSTPCKAHYRCGACGEPFDLFKCL